MTNLDLTEAINVVNAKTTQGHINAQRERSNKNKQMYAVSLDVALERRTKRCSPRFLPGYRFWIKGSDTCRQAVRERKVGP